MKMSTGWLIVIALLIVSVAACGDDDDDGGQTPADTGPIVFTSDAFASGQPIPVEYTCDGENISPPLQWSRLPEGTESLAVEMIDPDAGDYVHWVLFDLPPDIPGLRARVPAEAAPRDDGAKQAINTSGETGYSGPCPPEGQEHEYVFRLYALDAMLGLDGGGSARNVQEALAEHTLALSEVTGTYTRQEP